MTTPIHNTSEKPDVSYQQTLHYLFSRLPMFTRDGASAYKADLRNTIRLCKLLDNPQDKFKSIHVAGTNGKGSTSHMLAAILQVAGYKTGLYTSPHLRDFRERIRINGKMIGEKEVVDFIGNHYEDIEAIKPSFFEVTVAMAFNHFTNSQIDIAVIEVGLGGRLDSTNIISPLLSIITNIGYDHVNILGNALQTIAFEKAGIIKQNIPVIIGQRQPEVEDVFINKALETGSAIKFASDEWQIQSMPGTEQDILNVSAERIDPDKKDYNKAFRLDLTGMYQLKNLAPVLSAVEELRKLGFRITDDHVFQALGRVKELTGLAGRWQTLGTHPLIICDTGHNEDGIKEVIKNIENTAFNQLHIVFGVLKDKDVSSILAMLPKTASYYFCQPDIPRAKPVAELIAEAEQGGIIGEGFLTVADALAAAKNNADSNDMIFIGGSTFVVAEVV